MADEKPFETGPQPSLNVRQGDVQGQTFGPPRPEQTEFPLHETHLASDRVITDHNDPDGTKYQFRGVDGPHAPLPIGGADHDARLPEEVFTGTPHPESE